MSASSRSVMDRSATQATPETIEVLLSYWRRRRTFWVVFGTALLTAVLLALLWPPTYRSTATILIEQQEIPQDLVRSTISSYADQRIQVISQRELISQH